MDQNNTTQQQTTTTNAATNEPIILNESPISPKKDRRMSDEWGKSRLDTPAFPYQTVPWSSRCPILSIIGTLSR